MAKKSLYVRCYKKTTFCQINILLSSESLVLRFSEIGSE